MFLGKRLIEEPDHGYDAKAAEWRDQLTEQRAKSRQPDPAAPQVGPPTNGPSR